MLHVSRLDPHFLIELSGKYAVSMYELLESVANKEVPVLEASVDQLRQWLKVPTGKLTRWQDFRRFVLEPAVKQLNENPEGAGFTVDVQLQKEGRAIKWVQFVVSKTAERMALEATLVKQVRASVPADVRLHTSTYEQAKKLARGWDVYDLAAQWQEWGKQQKDWPPANPDGAFLGFCKKRGPAPGR
jgi:plasmid replication initiation protein